MITSQQLFQPIIDFYQSKIEPLYEQYISLTNAGGKMRSTVGDLYEEIAEKIIHLVDPNIVIKHKDHIWVESRPGSGIFGNFHLDWHLYLNGKLIALMEVKTYADKPMFGRAVTDGIRYIREVHPDVPVILCAGQDAVGSNMLEWYSDRYDLKYFILNKTKKRNSKNPIFKTKDPLVVEDLQSLYDHIKQIADSAS